MAAKRKKAEAVVTEAQVLTLPIPSPVEPVAAPAAGEGVFQLVESNIKGGVRAELGPCTAVVSRRNRVGKTSVLDSFRFALTGTHPIGPHASDLTGLTKDGSFPHATISGVGVTASARFPKGKKSVDHHVVGPLAHLMDEQRKGLLPLSSTRDLLTLGSAKAREELFRRFGDGLTSAPEPKGLDEQQRALFKRAYDAGSGDVVERLASAGTWVRSHKRALSERLKALEEEKSRLFGEASEDGAVTDDLITALEAKLGVWDAYKRGEVARQSLAAAEANLNAAIDRLNACGVVESDESFNARMAQEPFKIASDRATEHLLKLQDGMDEASKRLRMLEAVLTLRKALDGGACYVCATDFHSDVHALVMAAEQAIQNENTRLASGHAAIAEAKAEALRLQKEWQEMFTRAAVAHNLARTQRAAAEASVKTLAEVYKQLLTTVEGFGGLTAPDESEESIKVQLDKAKLALAHSDRGEEVSAAIRTLKDEQGDCKAVEVVLEHTLTKLLEGVRDRAQGAVNAWMPSGFRAQLCLENEDGKPECRWEVLGADGQPHRKGALSGAEWAALSVAIACAWTEGQPYRYLLLDDTDIAGFNADNVESILHMLSKAVQAGRLTQVLVAWSRPQEIPSEGWTVVEL